MERVLRSSITPLISEKNISGAMSIFRAAKKAVRSNSVNCSNHSNGGKNCAHSQPKAAAPITSNANFGEYMSARYSDFQVAQCNRLLPGVASQCRNFVMVPLLYMSMIGIA
jgi:hypothetical protein